MSQRPLFIRYCNLTGHDSALHVNTVRQGKTDSLSSFHGKLLRNENQKWTTQPVNYLIKPCSVHGNLASN